MDTNFAGSDNLKSLFGKLPDNREIFRYTLKNRNGVIMDVINYGATITSLKIPISVVPTDVVLGFDNLTDYTNSLQLPAPPHFGAAIGRYAGRIKNGKFSIDGNEYALEPNNGSNTLHGGRRGFDKVVWEVTDVDDSAITLFYKSPDGDQQFPGQLDVTVNYRLTDDNSVVITYDALALDDTIINMTQHSYFNLDGHDADVTGQQLQINSDWVLEIDGANIPSGRIIPAADKGFDFTVFRNVPTSIDDSFVIKDTAAPVAILKSVKNGLHLTVYSDQPSLHIYVGGDLFGKFKGKSGAGYHPHSGICFESQNYPDAPNQPDFPTAILRKGGKYHQKTKWKFSNKDRL